MTDIRTRAEERDAYEQRVDVLTSDFARDAKVLPVEHPEWFRHGDIVRVGDIGCPQEAVLVRAAPEMVVQRALGAFGPQFCAAGQRVFIVGRAQ